MQKLVLKNIQSALGLPISEYHRLKMVLDNVREAFSADRCWLLYPCDLNIKNRIIPLESTSEAYPGVNRLKSYDAAAPVLQHICEILDQTEQPILFSLNKLTTPGLNEGYAHFNVKTQLACKISFDSPQTAAMAIGLHHCEKNHTWTEEEISALSAIASLIKPILESLLNIPRLLSNLESSSEIIDNSPMAQVIYNMDRRIVYANEKYLQLNERPLDDLINNGSRQYFKQEDHAKYDVFFDTILNTGKATAAVHKKRGDGALLLIENTGTIIHFFGKKHYLIACKDITAEVATKNALENSLGIKQAIMEASEDGIVVEDVNRNVITLNQNFINYFKLDLTVTSALSCSTLSILESCLTVVKNAQTINELVSEIATDSEKKALIEIILNDGSIIELSSFPLIYQNAIHGRVWYFKDITQKVNSTKALQSSLEIRHAIMEASDDGMLVENVNREVITVNKTFTKTFNIPKRLTTSGNIKTRDALLAGLPLMTNAEEIRHIVSSASPTSDVKSAALIHLRNGSVLDMSSFPLAHQGSVQGRVWYFKDMTEKLKLTRRLSFEATHDPLTKLINRRGFDDKLSQAIIELKASHEIHALLYLDLDRFKIINDSCGHGAGDIALIQISELLSQHLRSADTLARVGGDEFCILLKNCLPETVQKIGDQLRRQVDKFVFLWDEKEYKIGVSIGVVLLDESITSYEEALRLADTSCYLAKEQGRNRIHFHTSADQAVLLRLQQNNIVSQIHEALKTDQFICYVQKICTTDSFETHTSPELCNYEVLVRMTDGKGNMIPPNVFLPPAERYKLMYQIDHWVIKNAIAAMATIQHKFTWFSINLSGQTISQESSFELIKTAIQKAGIPANKICFEITETAAITNPEFGLSFLYKLRELGCLIALDDFGSGLSSYEYLKKLPADILKIDGQFIKNMIEDELDLVMVKSINEIAHIMGKKTVGEFVENEEILLKLNEIGVDYGQGFYLDTPKPMSSLLDLDNS